MCFPICPESCFQNEMPCRALGTSFCQPSWVCSKGEADDEDDTPFSGLSALSHEQANVSECTMSM